MGTPNVDDIGATLSQELESIGPVLGPIMLLLSLFLIFRGHEKLQFAAAITGAGIGYTLTGFVYEQLISNNVPVRQDQTIYVMGVLIVICASIMAATVQMSIRMMAGFFIYISFSGLFVFLNENGYEVVDSQAITGGMAIVAFFAVRLIRNILPILVSSLMGALGLMGAVLLLSGEPLTMLSPTNSSTAMMVCVLFLLSFAWQYTDIRRKKKKEHAEMNPEIPDMQHVARGNNQVQARRRRAGDLPDLRDLS
ncbi:MAG TPA: hypothetical protein QF401_01935 [Candidatus Poseidoniaceae archaeon]|nr:hypothetical protein [Candidatus Poseidoniaceae archaeon]